MNGYFSFYILVYASKNPFLVEAAVMLGVSEQVIFLKHNSDPVVLVEGGIKEVVSLIPDLIPAITAYVKSCLRLSGQKRRVSWAEEDEVHRTVLVSDTVYPHPDGSGVARGSGGGDGGGRYCWSWRPFHPC